MEEENFLRVRRGQIYTFSRWCDDADFAALLLPGANEKDLLRLCAVAIQIGFTQLALFLIIRMEAEGFEKITAFSKDYENGVLSNEIKQKWVRGFVEKQPPGKERNRLLKKLCKFRSNGSA